MRNITLAGDQPNDPVLQNKFIYESPKPRKRGNERLQVNDCVLRNVQKYKYIACIDIDEIIVPQNESTWSEMMELVEKDKVDILNMYGVSSSFLKNYIFRKL